MKNEDVSMIEKQYRSFESQADKMVYQGHGKAFEMEAITINHS